MRSKDRHAPHRHVATIAASIRVCFLAGLWNAALVNAVGAEADRVSESRGFASLDSVVAGMSAPDVSSVQGQDDYPAVAAGPRADTPRSADEKAPDVAPRISSTLSPNPSKMKA